MSSELIYQRVEPRERLFQGEILANVVERAVKRKGDEEFSEATTHTFAIVVTQDCDLEQDHGARTDQGRADNPSEQKKREAAMLPRVLLVEAADASLFRSKLPGSDVYKRAHKNKDERYQFLAASAAAQDLAGVGVPSLFIDFKRYMTLPMEELLLSIRVGETQRRTRLRTPFAEQVSSRFGYFLLRIPLPIDHDRVAEPPPPAILAGAALPVETSAPAAKPRSE